MNDYYNKHAKEYIDSTKDCDMSYQYEFFEKHLPKNCKTILDIGFGSGRDMQYFKSKGYDVYGIDPTIEFVNNAKELGLNNVKCLKVQELNENKKYDAIWACASLLHIDKKELKDAFKRCYKALKEKGIMYCSFKYGNFEGIKDDRYFIYMNEYNIYKYLENTNLKIIDKCITTDVRQDRNNEKWYNVIIAKDPVNHHTKQNIKSFFKRIKDWCKNRVVKLIYIFLNLLALSKSICCEQTIKGRFCYLPIVIDWCLPAMIAINIGVTAIFTISLSIRRDKIHGISIADYYKLLSNNHFQIDITIFILIAVSLMELICGTYDYYFLMLCTLIENMIFVIIELCDHLPILFQREHKYYKIIRKALFNASKNKFKDEQMEILGETILFTSCFNYSLLELYKRIKNDK